MPVLVLDHNTRPRPLRTLGARLTITIVVAVGLCLAAFVALTIWRLDEGASQQIVAIEKLADERFSRELEIEAKLFASVFERVVRELHDDLSSMAASAEALSVAERGNIVAIDLFLKRHAETSRADGIVMLDHNRGAVGSHKPGLTLVTADAWLKGSVVHSIAGDMLVSHGGIRPAGKGVFHRLQSGEREILGLNGKLPGLLLIVVQPVFDDFGDVKAFLVGYHDLSQNGSDIIQLARSEQVTISLAHQGETLLNSGRPESEEPVAGAKTNWSRCQPSVLAVNVCVSSSGNAVRSQSREIEAMIEYEKQALSQFVVLLTGFGLFLAANLVGIITKRVLAPLVSMTAVIRSVADGNWLARIHGLDRDDEVGSIAKALKVLQRSVQEREKLQADIADVEDVLSQRREIEQMIVSFSMEMRQGLFRMNDGCDAVETQTKCVGELSRLAESEADETRLVVQRLTSQTGDTEASQPFQRIAAGSSDLAVECIDRLSETLAKLNGAGEDLLNAVAQLIRQLQLSEGSMRRFQQHATLKTGTANLTVLNQAAE